MKQNEKILKYLSDYMAPDEKLEFEKELNNSEELRQKLESYKTALNEMKLPHADEESFYFNNLLPRVRERISGKHRLPLLPKLAAGSALVVLLFLMFNPFGRNSQNIEQVLVNSSYNSQNEILASIEEGDPLTLSVEELSDTDELLSDRISTELQVTELSERTEYIETSYLIENISDAEADEIYNELLNKEILQEK